MLTASRYQHTLVKPLDPTPVSVDNFGNLS